jgi:hypothetical protein
MTLLFLRDGKPKFFFNTHFKRVISKEFDETTFPQTHKATVTVSRQLCSAQVFF